MTQIRQQRILSIDIFRAVTMLLMIFVNDLWSLTGVPKWLEHAAASEDYLGLSDVVFPCFLFIVGMSVPYAVKARLEKGESVKGIIRHILVRSFALLIMGVYIVNLDNFNEAASGMNRQAYQILMVAAFFLIWNVYPDNKKSLSRLFTFLQFTGILLLVFLAYRYRGDENGMIVMMKPQWWGILGLIGWSYLGCALIYLLVYKREKLLFGVWLLLVLISIVSQSGLLVDLFPGMPGSLFIGDGAFHLFTLSGMIATFLLNRYKTYSRLILLYFILGFSLVSIGLLLNNFFIISKIQATPPWVFISSGIAFFIFALIYYFVDIRGKARFFRPLKVAGSSTLTCYLLPYLIYSLCTLSGITLPEFLKEGMIGLLKSMFFASLVIYLTGLLGRLNIRLNI